MINMSAHPFPLQESIAETLNRECDCSVADLPTLRRQIEHAMEPGQAIVESHPHLFSATPVFLQAAHVDQMRRVIESIEAIAHLPAYQQAVLAQAPPVAHVSSRTSGAFMGFDFHITPSGPKLIEINTNAGGAFLNIAAQGSHRACCEAADGCWPLQPGLEQSEAEVISMLKHEWRLARGDAELRTIAIVDENPRRQFLYPEFQLARRLFESHGLRALIVDPSKLEITGNTLRSAGERVDLVYNRLTDFYFEAPGSQVLRVAYEQDLSVITPHPRAHALYANKRNLVLLSDAGELERLGAERSAIEHLGHTIPPTREVNCGDEHWWQERKGWFFKPRNGFGSRGVYRGDKLTRRVFAEVANGGYLAQEFTPASERRRSVAGNPEIFKVDVRCYVYAGKIQLMAARLYQGQTTNFRTAGGGFAPVYVIDEAALRPETIVGPGTSGGRCRTPCRHSPPRRRSHSRFR
ncbi:MAG TPA: hypothetical protein PKN91_08040 [Steroidobacteraceae bacterium]|nr:hypothetical protein [Steroidobacteraceae bacterium]